jgi:hypothetical protein
LQVKISLGVFAKIDVFIFALLDRNRTPHMTVGITRLTKNNRNPDAALAWKWRNWDLWLKSGTTKTTKTDSFNSGMESRIAKLLGGRFQRAKTLAIESIVTIWKLQRHLTDGYDTRFQMFTWKGDIQFLKGLRFKLEEEEDCCCSSVLKMEMWLRERGNTNSGFSFIREYSITTYSSNFEAI